MSCIKLAICVVGLTSLTAVADAPAAIAFNMYPVVRDFHVTQPDFEIINWNTQTPAAFFANNQNNKIEKGIVGPILSLLGINGLPVYSSVREPGFYNTVGSASSFSKWFANSPGQNVVVPGIAIPFTDNLDGTYSYSNISYFPIDNLGFGKEGFDHNYHFTAHIHQPFTYSPGQDFSIISDDDAWVFIDNKLVIDAGGMHGTLGGAVDLDTLGLADGSTYSIDIFFAERNRYGSSLFMTTNIFFPVPEPGSLTLLVGAVGAMVCGRRRRALGV